jgi:hypothetical protein
MAKHAVTVKTAIKFQRELMVISAILVLIGEGQSRESELGIFADKRVCLRGR